MLETRKTSSGVSIRLVLTEPSSPQIDDPQSLLSESTKGAVQELLEDLFTGVSPPPGYEGIEVKAKLNGPLDKVASEELIRLLRNGSKTLRDTGEPAFPQSREHKLGLALQYKSWDDIDRPPTPPSMRKDAPEIGTVSGQRNDLDTVDQSQVVMLLREQNELLRRENEILRQQQEQLQGQIKSFGDGIAAHVTAEMQEVRKQVESLAKPKNVATLMDGLTPTQRSVLEAIQKLPTEAMEKAATQLALFEGQPFTEAFAKSFSSVLREKKWSVLCGTCGAVATVYWHADARYAENGRAFFSHPSTDKSSAKVQHGSLTAIPRFKLTQRFDKRLKSR